MLISGPVNVARLVGNTRTIRLYSDVHLPITKQTKCNAKSESIQDYFDAEFKIANQPIDFFVEARFEDRDRVLTENPNYLSKNNYMETIQHMFFDNTSSNLVVVKSKYPNVRFHSLDIRDRFFSLGYSFWLREQFVNPNGNLTVTNNSIEILLNDIYTDKVILQMIKTFNFRQRQQTNELDTILNKIFNKYNNQSVRTRVMEIVADILIPFIDETIQLLDNLFTQLKSFKLEYNKIINHSYYFSQILNRNESSIQQLIKDANLMLTNVISLVTDIYSMRRIMDKNYIRHVVLYAGQGHILHHLIMLVKYFDFDVTNMAKHRLNTIAEVNRKLRANISRPVSESIDRLDMLIDPIANGYEDYNDGLIYISQCSDVSTFPNGLV